MQFSDEELACITLALHLCCGKKKRHRREWMKNWYRKRANRGHENLLAELKLKYPDYFFNYLRMDVEAFEALLNMVKPLTAKKRTIMRDPISARERLSVTLRYLATGNTYADLKFISCISPASISGIVIETCNALIHALRGYMQFPRTEGDWEDIASGFYDRWNFPNCLGAMDGKHIQIRKPSGSGSHYYNYKGTFSIVLLALVDWKYDFIMVDIGVNGRISDGGVLGYTKFGQMLKENNLQIPQAKMLPNSNRILPYVIVGDDAFALTENLMKPYSIAPFSKEKRIFNYRLSRARRISENAFGILAARFGVFQRQFLIEPEVRIVALACCYLHNYLRHRNRDVYTAQPIVDTELVERGEIIQGSWRSSVNAMNCQASQTKNCSERAKVVRDEYCSYFNDEGKVPWQDKFVLT